CARGNWDPDYW
nr:immunoglobulin heavy chain junction region [Mus musculus]